VDDQVDVSKCGLVDDW